MSFFCPQRPTEKAFFGTSPIVTVADRFFVFFFCEVSPRMASKNRGVKRPNPDKDAAGNPDKDTASPLRPDLFGSVDQFKQSYDKSQPYHHVVIPELCLAPNMRTIREEILELEATFKETDMFKVPSGGQKHTLLHRFLLPLCHINFLNLRRVVRSIKCAAICAVWSRICQAC